MSFLYSVIGFLIAISVLVAVHEFGHFWVARKLGVKVLKFSIGFGKPLFSWTGKIDQTEYRIAAIPLGGFVQMLGENDPDQDMSPAERSRSFDAQPIWKRSAIAVAGPAINFLFAALLFIVLGLSPETQFAPKFGDVPEASELGKLGVGPNDVLVAVDGRPVEHLGEYNLYVFNKVLKGEAILFSVVRDGELVELTVTTENIPLYNISPATMIGQLGLYPKIAPATSELGMIVEDSPAQAAGLMAGDRITAIDGTPVNTWRELTALIIPSGGRALEIEFVRDQASMVTIVTPRLDQSTDPPRALIGVGRSTEITNLENTVVVQRNVVDAFIFGVEQTWLISELTVRMLGKMISLQVSPKNVNGPITIADVAGQTIQIDWQAYLHFLAVISISLGIMNLLPIPMLDGGHLMMFAVEAVAGRRASEIFYGIGQRIGIVLLVGLMSLAFYNDIFRILN